MCEVPEKPHTEEIISAKRHWAKHNEIVYKAGPKIVFSYIKCAADLSGMRKVWYEVWRDQLS